MALKGMTIKQYATPTLLELAIRNCFTSEKCMHVLSFVNACYEEISCHIPIATGCVYVCVCVCM